jgi:hypothetical protein
MARGSPFEQCVGLLSLLIDLKSRSPGLPHGMPTTHGDIINADLLEFIRS